MKKIFFIFFSLFIFHFTLIAQVWLPICEGVRNKSGNPSVNAMAYDSVTDKLFIAGDFDSICHRCYNGYVGFDDLGIDTSFSGSGCNKSTYISKLFHYSKYLYYGFDDGRILKSNLIDTIIGIGQANGIIYSFEYYKGNLYASGDFTIIKWGVIGNQKTINCNNIARFDGTNWYALGNGLTYEFNDSYIHALKVWNNELYAGGFFRDINGHCIARWDGTKWLDSLPGFTATWAQFGESVEALEVYNGQLYAGGGFDRAGNTTAYMIAQWDSSAKEWSPLAQGLSSYVLCLNEIDGRLWAGGYFGKEGPFPVNHIGYWDDTSWHDVGFESGGRVYVIEGYHGDIFVGGNFIYPDFGHTVFSPNLARLDPDSIAVGVTEPISETEQLSIYPNPVSEQLTVSLPTGQASSEQLATSYEIRNMLGQTVLLTTHNSQLTTEIDVSALPPGFYLLEARSRKGVTVGRFIKQ